jgi:hypothetical protein
MTDVALFALAVISGVLAVTLAALAVQVKRSLIDPMVARCQVRWEQRRLVRSLARDIAAMRRTREREMRLWIRK